MAGCFKVEADEPSLALDLYEGIEWTLDMDIVQEIVGRFYNYISLDQILMQWRWMPFQYLGLNNMSIFCIFQHPQYGFTEDCGRRGGSISSSPIMKSQSWWPQLAHLSMDFPIKFPPACKLLYQP